MSEVCECGTNLTKDNYYEYTPFGNQGDIDPPDPIYCCKVCADKIDKTSKSYGVPMMWHSPTFIGKYMVK